MGKTPEIGEKAPDFHGIDQKKHPHQLSDYAGKKLVLFFYPKDDTPGCTKEACNLRDNYKALKDAGYEVVGVSIDSMDSHVKFATKYDLPFPLLADTDQKIVEAYGVWGEKNMYGKKYMGTNRTTFVIDEEGLIQKVFKKVKTDDHAAQILAAV